jgi:DNA-directed RNA polymerase specialized sigma24 family protein
MTKKKKPQKPTKKLKNKSSLPHGVSEEEFLNVLDNISKRLGHKFKFGYHSYDDMKQQAAIFALEGLEKYDKKRPLENFLWTHVRNRLFNYKRDNYQRPDKPCLTCPLYDAHCKKSTNQCLEFTNKSDCELYSAWETRNNSKKNIMKPVGIEDIEDYGSKHHTKGDVSELVFNQEIIDLLDEKIPSSHRETYLKLKYGEKICKSDLNKLLQIIREIIDEQY